MSEHLLSKITPSSVNLHSLNVRSINTISSSDIAAAFAYGSLPKYAYYAALAKYCADKAAEGALIKYFEYKIQTTIVKNGWHDREGRARGLALLAIHEGIYGVKCKPCRGRGFMVKGKTKAKILMSAAISPCLRCHGSGEGGFSETRRAKIAKISTSNWIRTWKLRNDQFVQGASELHDKALRHIRCQLL
jgi:hypothetical protein